MGMPSSDALGSPSVVPRESTAWGVSRVRRALERFETLIALALAIASLAVLEAYLSSAGRLDVRLPFGPVPFAEWWSIGLKLGVQAAIGVTIVVLVIVGIVVAVRELISWRQGVRTMAEASSESGPVQVEAVRRARTDHATTLWLFLVYVLAAIVVSGAFEILNWGLSSANRVALPDVVVSIATGLASSLVLVAIYYFGARHLVELLFSISSPTGQRLLLRGRDFLLAGALVGVGAALAPVSWMFDLVAVASLVIILIGVRRLSRAYALWLAGDRRPPTPVARYRPSPR